MIGQTLHNRYTIIARLGKGAMGTVYRATDSQTGQEVAVKSIARELAFDDAMLERFKREGEALRQLQHPNIVGFVDAFQYDPAPSGGAGGQYVIVMEYVPGGSLHDLIKQGPLPIDRIRRMALELCDALTRAHHLNIIHRDLKPENILIAEDGTPKLTDFGVARLAEGVRMTGTGTQIGTPYYMSPEAWEGQPLDAQTDIWSLGIVLYEMLVGAVPFGGDTMVAVMNKVLSAPLPELKTRRPDVPDGLAAIVQKMLARDKAERYRTMREAAADLERGQPTHPLPTVKPTAVAPAKPAGWQPIAIGLALVSLIAIVAVAFVLQSQQAQAFTLTELASAPTATFDLNSLATQFAIATATHKASTDATRTVAAIVRSTKLALTPSRTPRPTITATPTATPILPGAILYSEDFEDGKADGLVETGAFWKVKADEDGNQVYEVDTTEPEVTGSTIGFGFPYWSDYALEYRVKFLNTESDVWVAFRTSPQGSYIQRLSQRGQNLELSVDWQSPRQRNFTFVPDVWYTVRVEAQSETIRVYVDGDLKFEMSDSTYKAGIVRIGNLGTTLAYFDNIRVIALAP